MKDNKIIPLSKIIFSSEEKNFLNKFIDKGINSTTENYVEEFEKRFAKYCKSKYAAAVSSGTAALHLLLKALKIGLNDEVIVPDLTHIATANTVVYTGAKPVFIDSELENWNMSPKLIEEKITPKTKAIIAVHLYGQPADLKELNRICQKYNLYLIEDCAEALGAEFSGRKVGTFGAGGCFSFSENNIISCFEGGMIVTNNLRLYEKIFYLRNHAMSEKKKFFYSEIGYNYKLSPLQAVVGIAQLEKIENIIKIRKEIEQEYMNYLENVDNLEFQQIYLNRKKICWLFSMLVKQNKKNNRTGLIKYLYKNKIESSPFFIPMTELPPYYSIQKINSNAKFISNTGINLPTHNELDSNQIKYICNKIKDYLK